MAAKQRKIRDSVLKLSMLISVFSLLLSASSCNFDDVGRIGRGIVTGRKIEKHKPVEVVPNIDNYVIYDKAFGSFAIFKYTVLRAYVAENLSMAGISQTDFNTELSDRYFNEDGSLKDNTKTIAIIEMEMEKQADGKDIVGIAEEINIHCIPSMSLMGISKEIEYLADVINYFYLDQTEDITRSDDPDEYYYFSMSKGQTANFKIAFIVDKDILKRNDLCLYVGRGYVEENGEVKQKLFYIPLSIEQEESQ